MKSIKKFLFIMVALATALAFVSCSNGSDDGGSSNSNSNSNNSSNNNADNSNSSNNNGGGNNNTVAKPSVVATYEADRDAYTLTFFRDNTFIETIDFFGEEKEYIGGTYEGNPSRNGYITITVTKEINEYTGILKDLPIKDQKEYDIQINSGKLYFDDTYFSRQ